MADESVQQPDHLPCCEGCEDKGICKTSGTALKVCGQPPAGGDDQPDHHRCGTVFRRIVNGIFPVFHRDCYDFRNACLYAWYSCTDCVGRDLDHTGIFVCSKLYCKRTYTMFQKQSETRAGDDFACGGNDWKSENSAGIRLWRGSVKAVRCNQSELADMQSQSNLFSPITNPSTRFVNGLVYAGVGITGAVFAMRGAISVGQLSCFLTYANQYTKPFNEISSVITELQNALACARRVFDFIEEETETVDQKDAVVLSQVQGEVKLVDVSFSYQPEVPLLEHLNLTVKPGQKIAIVGPTGCGKTTLINLLMRFYDLDGGQILLDGNAVSKVTKDSLRASFGMVLQETWLKSGSIAENIAYGNPQATREEIIHAAKEAHAHSFITRMPDGYDTVISEEGGNLSQGQKQLLCIARVMLRLPPVLILDEATSSIDTRTEIQVQKAFEKLMEGRTSFIVAHRLSTIRTADRILVMKDGNIIEQGTHEELLSQNGFYRQLYEVSLHR